MATWMAHLRVAEGILERFSTLQRQAFLMGTIAPDSGIPNADWTSYTPDKETSHFKVNGELEPDEFVYKYMTEEQWSRYNDTQKAFYLGYYTHLLTDCRWVEKIYRPKAESFAHQKPKDKMQMIWAFKSDWYDLDHLYFRKHPDFSAFLEYEQAKDFRNTFMEEFSEDAFENRRVYITGFYREQHENLDREYSYLNEDTMDTFVAETAETCADVVARWLK